MQSRFSTTAVMLLAALLAVGCNSQTQSVQNPAGTTATPAAAASPAASPLPQIPTVHADGVRRVTLEELRGMISRKEAFVLDVRNDASFNAGHIPGAKLIPVEDVGKRAGELPKDKLIVTYCS